MTNKMISTNELSVFILNYHQNRICNKNLRSIQDIIHARDMAFKKYKGFCNDFPHLSILAKSATPDKVQLTFTHASVGNKYLGNPLQRPPWQDYSTQFLSFQSTLILHLPRTATISAFPSLKLSFFPPPATSRGRKISGTGRCATPSSSRHS